MASDDKVNILLVDDQPAKLLSYETILAELDERLIKAASAKEALEHLLKHEIAVILVDVCMPELDGFQLAAMIREHPRFQRTAIIFISAIHLTDVDRLRAYEMGAVDYVPVPVIPEVLRAKVKVFAELYRKTRQLEQLNQELERRVAERTAELEASTVRLLQSELRVCRPNGELRWCIGTAVASVDGTDNVVRISGVTVDITDRKQAEERQVLLAREVDHRARNALALVQSIVRLTRSEDIKSYITAVDGRIGALARAHTLLAQSRWQGADLSRLLEEELSPYRAGDDGRISVRGPEVSLEPRTAQTLALALHELSTNAAKYGALSVVPGRVEVAWELQ